MIAFSTAFSFATVVLGTVELTLPNPTPS